MVHLHHRLGPILVHHGSERVIGHAGIVAEAEIGAFLALKALREGVHRRTVGEIHLHRAGSGAGAGTQLLQQAFGFRGRCDR